MILWRIATATRLFDPTDLSGAGAAKNPGRWNAAGDAILYAAPAISLAVLETAAHIDDAGLPLNRYLVELLVPDDVWNARRTLSIATLPATWSAIPVAAGSVTVGSEWLASYTTALMAVPSVIVPEEFNVLVNPAHPDSQRVTARVVRRFDYNNLFRRAA